jgi:hypothetical protein
MQIMILKKRIAPGCAQPVEREREQLPVAGHLSQSAGKTKLL